MIVKDWVINNQREAAQCVAFCEQEFERRVVLLNESYTGAYDDQDLGNWLNSIDLSELEWSDLIRRAA